MYSVSQHNAIAYYHCYGKETFYFHRPLMPQEFYTCTASPLVLLCVRAHQQYAIIYSRARISLLGKRARSQSVMYGVQVRIVIKFNCKLLLLTKHKFSSSQKAISDCDNAQSGNEL